MANGRGSEMPHCAAATQIPEGSRLILPKDTLKALRLVAGAQCPVLLTGATGTGKSTAARMIHALSARAHEPFSLVDCASLPPSLIEAELFGHVRGAFTGADRDRPGRFALAGRGTVFLDEIGEMELGAQKKLLRVLNDGEFEAVGSSQSIPMNARVIAASNRDLRLCVKQGDFRADLFFRLSTTSLRLPDVGEHPEDLEELLAIGLVRAAERLKRKPPRLDPDFARRLSEHDWPGNVRELMNVLYEALLYTPEESDVLPTEILDRVLPSAEPAGQVQRDAGCPHCGAHPARPAAALGIFDGASPLEATLRATGGNVSRAARRLGLPRSTLRYRIQRKGLSHLLPTD